MLGQKLEDLELPSHVTPVSRAADLLLGGLNITQMQIKDKACLSADL